MRFVLVDLALGGLLCVGCALAQPAVPAAGEPHHHTAYEDARVRILEFQTEPHEPALPNRYDTDFVWVNDTGIHFSRAGVHAEGNREVMVELLQPPTGPRNVCAEVLPGEYLHCHEPGPEWLGANLQIQFETDQMRIGILQIAPNARLAVPPADVPPLLIPLEGTEAEATSRVNGASTESASRHVLKPAEVLRSPADRVSEVRNIGTGTARFLVVEFGGAGE
jgi:hypothetical protein